MRSFLPRQPARLGERRERIPQIADAVQSLGDWAGKRRRIAAEPPDAPGRQRGGGEREQGEERFGGGGANPPRPPPPRGRRARPGCRARPRGGRGGGRRPPAPLLVLRGRA